MVPTEQTGRDPQYSNVLGLSSAVERPVVLVIDDEPLVLRFMVAALGDRYHVLTAGDGFDALRLIETHAGPVSLVICDWHLPRMEGIEVGLHIRRKRPGTPVLLVSGEPCPEPLPGGFSAFPKPFTARELRERVGGELRG